MIEISRKITQRTENTIRTFDTAHIAHKAHNLNVHRKLKTKRWIRNVLSVFQTENVDEIFSGNEIFRWVG